MSLGTSNRDGGKTSESGHLRALAKIVSGDIITGLNAVQRAAGVNMSVDVQVGDAFVRRSDGSYAHPVFNDAVYNQVISAADGSNPRRDIVVLYVDYNQAPSTAVSNNTNGVVKIKVVNGTPAGSPTDPNDAAIQSSVGSGNPWTKLARVRVPAGQTSISNSLIDDLRTMITNLPDTVNTAALQAASVTPAKRSGGYKVGVIAGSTFGTTGNKSVTGLGFKPKMVEFFILMASTGSGFTTGMGEHGFGVMDEAGNQFAGAGSAWGGGGANQNSMAKTDHCIIRQKWQLSATPFMSAKYVSMDADGFTINCDIASNEVAVGWKAYA